MRWQRRINAALGRRTGWELRRVTEPKTPRVRVDPTVDRLLKEPIFLLSSIRSGSTLLRVILDSHSQLHAPHELHLRDIQVKLASKYAARAVRELRLDEEQLEHLLWDRMLDWELHNSGKRWFVNKTPNDVFIWRRIVACWPDSRFVYLLRHPLAMARSREQTRPHEPFEVHVEAILEYANALEEARRERPGHSVRYEDLTADAERETRRLCEFLGVAWEPGMLQYGEHDHVGRFKPGLGDWSEQIKSGRVQAARPLPDDEIPDALRPLAQAWGYATAPEPAERPAG
jgi:hypothetical protein